MSRLSASISRPMAIFLMGSAASSGRTLGRALVLPFLARGVTRLQAITSVKHPGPLAPATAPTRAKRSLT
eukprot:4413303-Alexandrium_andersonii.AAC.1